MAKWGTGKVARICQYCGVGFMGRHDRLGKFCSKSCTAKANARPKNTIVLVCQECGKEYNVQPCRANSSRYCSCACRGKNMPRGENAPNWKGGVSNRTQDAKNWAAAVILRDEFCQECGADTNLQAHHIESWGSAPDKRYDLDNGITLCGKCHSRKHPDMSPDLFLGISRRRVIPCFTCGTLFVAKRRSSVFCSVKCKHEGQWKYWRMKHGKEAVD
jgi:5-methylcytosine-specific restriction endonuclease McrA